MNGTPWQKGDLALCVNDGPLSCQCGAVHTNARYVEKGAIYVVAFETPAAAVDQWCARIRCHCPVIVAVGGRSALSSRFRKIEPHTPDEEDAETIRLLTGANVEVG